MICCLNPHCQNPQNSDDANTCQSCGTSLTRLRGRYRSVSLLGQGGFGRTYLALDEDRLNARCVIKQFSPQTNSTKSLEKALGLFNQEAVRLYELGEHAQIPTLLAYFEQENYLYLVQEFVEGQSLLQQMRQQGAFNERQIRDMLADVLPVLRFVHKHQVIHRDITPTNILRRKVDDRLVLIDFGVAKQINANASDEAGTRIGTEGYSPLEQFRSGKAYPASDLYSLGTTCLHLMTQTRPDNLYDPLNGRWLWREHLQQEKGVLVSDQLAHVLDNMLKDLVNDRYQTADEVMRDLNADSFSPITSTASHGTGASGPSAQSATAVPRSTASKPPSGPPSGTPSRSSGAPSSRSGTSTNPVSQTPNRSGSAFKGDPSNLRPLTAQTPPPPPSLPPSISNPALSNPASGHPVSRPSVSGAPIAQPTGTRIAAVGVSSGLGAVKSLIKPGGIKPSRCLYTLTNHSSWVTSLATSRVTQLFASSSLDDSIRIWNLNTGGELMVLRGHSRGVNAIAISPDGRTLVSGSDDYTIKIWSFQTGALLGTLTGHSRDVNALAITPDGKFLASGGEDRTIRMWHMGTGSLLKTLSGAAGMIKSVAISPDGKLLASGGLDNRVKLWKLQTGDQLHALAGHLSFINAIAFSPNSLLVATASKDKSIKLWNANSGELIRTLVGHTRDVNAIALTPDNKMLISGSSDTTIKLWELATGNLLGTWMGHTDSINALALSADNRFLVSGSSDKTIKIWQF